MEGAVAITNGLKAFVEELKMQGSRVSAFTDPNPAEIERAHALGKDRVELYTGPYADAFAKGQADSVLPAYVAAAKAARNLRPRVAPSPLRSG